MEGPRTEDIAEVEFSLIGLVIEQRVLGGGVLARSRGSMRAVKVRRKKEPVCNINSFLSFFSETNIDFSISTPRSSKRDDDSPT